MGRRQTGSHPKERMETTRREKQKCQEIIQTFPPYFKNTEKKQIVFELLSDELDRVNGMCLCVRGTCYQMMAHSTGHPSFFLFMTISLTRDGAHLPI